ncbi:hypothetical protein LCGC14_0447780 [marine sediment metagenome]|uniref:Uncharacterized protein n=1 Tax=marine sediment metagenome TaxID=412755 RepID=A0A0F9VSM1_9ZZZZ
MNRIDEGDLIFLFLGCVIVGSVLGALVYNLVFLT